MAAAPALWAVGRDVLWCLGLGLLLAVARDLLGLLAGNGRVLCFLWDVLAFAAASVLLYGFSAAASSAGFARWYTAAAMGAGALAWHWGASGLVHQILRGMIGAFCTLVSRVEKAAWAPVAGIFFRFSARKRAKKAMKEKKRAQKVTKRKKQLQNQRKILYN